MSNLAQALSQIKAMQQQSEDTISIDKARSAGKQEDMAYAKFVSENPGQPELYNAEAERLSTATDEVLAGITYHDPTLAKRQAIMQKDLKKNFLTRHAVQNTLLIAKKASVVSGQTYIDSFAAADITVELDGVNARNALLDEHGDELGAIRWDMLQKKAQEGRVDVLINRDDFDGAREFLATSQIDADKKTSLEGFIDRQERASRASDKLADDQAIEAELKVVDDILILPQDQFLASVEKAYKLIKDSVILPVKGVNGAGKEGQRKKLDDRVNAIRAGKVDPITQFDPSHYERLSRRIANNSSEVSTTEIGISVGRGEVGGLTGAQAEDLIRLKKLYDNADILGTDTHKIYMGALVGMRTGKAFSKDKAENSLLAARAMVALNRWAVRTPEATESDYQAFMDRLVDNSNLTGWQRLRIHGNLNEDRFAIQENLDEIEAELGIGRQVEMLHKDDGGVIMVAESDVEEALKEGHKRVK